MADKPEKFPDWAIEDEVDEVSGQLNVVEPPAQRFDSGWTRREIPPRQWMNWLARKTGLWFRWVEDRIESLGTASLADTGTGDNDVPTNSDLGTAAFEDDTRYAHRANDLSDLQNAATGRSNLGVSYASEAEALAGEAEDRVIAPARFGDQSLSTNGYQVLPGGLVIQWGTYEGPDTVATVSFPINFPNACLNIAATAGEGSSFDEGVENVAVRNFTTSSFEIRARAQERPTYWQAIGY